MKKLYFKVLSLTALLALVALLPGCKSEEELSPEMTLSESAVTVTADGGEVVVTFELLNSNAQVEARPSVEWIREIDLSQPGVLRFRVDENTEDVERVGRIDLSVPSLPAPAVLTVTQAISQPFETEILRIFETGVDLRITPRDEAMTYVATLVPKSSFDQMGGAQAYFDYIVAFYKSEALRYEMSLEDFLTESEALVTGVQTLDVRDLYMDTDYLIVIFGLDLQCNPLTRVIVEEFRTGTPEMLDIEFAIDYEITGNRVKMSVTPSMEDKYYYYDIMKKSDLESSGMTMEAMFQKMISTYVDNGTSTGMTVEETVSEICSRGAAEYEYKAIDPETEFVGYAFAVSESGLICSAIASKEFKTGDVNPSENQISLIVEGVSSDRANISVVTTNTDPYVLIIDKASNWEPFATDQEKIDELFSGRHDLERYVRNGNADGSIKDLTPETDYLVMAVGYFAGRPTTDLVMKRFTTLSESSASEMTFTFTVMNLSPYGADVMIRAEPASASFYCGVVAEQATVEDVERQTDEMVEYYLNLGYALNRAQLMKQFISKSMAYKTFNELNDNTGYKAFAVAIDDATGEFAGEISFSEVFVTPKAVVADVKATVEFDKYYDCYELSQLDPSFPPAPFAVVPLKLKIEGEAAGFYYYAFEEDMTDTEKYPDIKVINQLLSYGESSEMSFDYQSFYDTDLTVVAVAVDADGNYGPVFRRKIYVTKENVSPAEEYFNLNQQSKRRPAGMQMNDK